MASSSASTTTAAGATKSERDGALTTLTAKYTRQCSYVQLINDCRNKKELTRSDNIVLLKKYGFFLLEADNLLSDEQKLKKVLKILRSNPSTLIAALEELLPIEKELYERTIEKEKEDEAIAAAAAAAAALEEENRKDDEESTRDTVSVNDASTTGDNSPMINVNRTASSGNFTPPPSPMVAVSSSRKSLTSAFLGSGHSSISTNVASNPVAPIVALPPAPPPSPMPPPTLSSRELLQRLVKNVLTVLEMREESFSKDIRGRSHISDRNNILRDHILAMNKVLDSYMSTIILLYPDPQSRQKQCCVNLQSIYIEGLDFSSLNLKHVLFGNNKIKDCNFKYCQGLTVEQLAHVQAFDSKFDPEFEKQFHEFKLNQYSTQLNDINDMIEECKNSLDCLLNFFLFACVKEFDIPITVRPLSLEDLRRTTFSLMNDQDINAIPEDEEMSYIWMNENRIEVFQKTHEELCNMLQRMLQARNYYLPEEVLSLSIDRKTYNFEEEISSSKIYMEDMQKNFIYIQVKSEHGRITVEHLNERIIHIKQRQAEILEERKLRRDENNIYRRNVYLGQLNAELDPVLKQGPTERLSEVMKLSRGKKQYAVVDLRFTDVSRVNFDKIDFTNVYSQLTIEQERLYLTPSNRFQRYTLLYEFARTGNIDDLDCLVSECVLDINVQDERGTTALMHACIFKQENMVKHLIEKYKAKHDIKTPTGWDVISTLCSVRDADAPGKVDAISRRIAEFLIEKAGAKISVHNAARIGRVDLLKTFSKKELHSIDKATECSVAHIASRDNNCEILSYLFDVKFNFEQTHGLISSLLHRSGNNNSNNTHNNDDENEPEDAKPSALWVACENGCIEAAKLIITRCPRLKDKSYRHLTPVKIALKQGHMQLVRELKALGVMIDVEIAVALEDKQWIVAYLNALDAQVNNASMTTTSSSTTNSNAATVDGTPVQPHTPSAKEAKEAAIAAAALQQAELRKKQELCQTLLFACKYRWIQLVQDLIREYDVDLNHRFEKEYRNRAVDIVCSQGDVKLMSIFLEYVNIRFNLNESHPLCPSLIFTAINKKHWDILKMLLDKKPNLSCTHIHDKTVLHSFLAVADDAAMVSNTTTTNSNSSNNSGNNSGNNALMSPGFIGNNSTSCSTLLSSSLRYEIVKQMLDQGASVLAMDSFGNTPLHYAARVGDDIASLILRAFMNVKNEDKKSAIEIAEDNGIEVTAFRAID